MKFALSLILASLTFGLTARACDMCGTTLIEHPWDPRTGFTIGVSEQFTRMSTLQESGSEIDNVGDQYLNSSITQIFVGYHITPKVGVQVNVPLIYRAFRRATEGGLEEGRVQGLGDMSLTANWLALNHRTEDFSVQVGFSAGIKFPTGDSDRLAEEGAEGHGHGAAEESTHEDEEAAGSELARTRQLRHAAHNQRATAEAGPEEGDGADADADEELPEGVHGHDLALGSGSIDGVFSATVSVRWKRAFFNAELQYALRGEGDHDYNYADDLLWSGGPGFTLIDRETQSLALQLVCSGETKGEDEFRGTRADDTSVTQVFLGPKVIATWQDKLTAEFGVDLPVHQYNSGVQIVPDYRVRAVLSWSF
jgi:hypothetical protein